jgi:hypothetical protein
VDHRAEIIRSAPGAARHPALMKQLTAVREELDQLAAAIRRCEEDITAPYEQEAEIAVLEQQRADALAAAYLRGLAPDVRTLDAEITALKARVEPLKALATDAAAARLVLIVRQVSKQQLSHKLVCKGLK